MEHMHLVGVEQIQSAANRMVEAADRMSRAANTVHDAVYRHGEMMREFIERLEAMEEEEEDEE